MADAVPGATYHEVADLGHLALLRHHRGAVVDSLRALAPASP
jgi:hypothetical protein